MLQMDRRQLLNFMRLFSLMSIRSKKWYDVAKGEEMMLLTGKQKRVLRSRGQLLEPIVHVGKDGVSEESIAATNEVFNRRELIKVRVLKTAPFDTCTIAQQLAEATNSYTTGRVGFTFLLYRPNSSLKERIILPPALAEEAKE